jgi:hypothetical protein
MCQESVLSEELLGVGEYALPARRMKQSLSDGIISNFTFLSSKNNEGTSSDILRT